MTVRPTFTGPAAVPVNLTLALSPSVTSQASPGAQVLTATPTGGTGSVSYAWTATYVADGTSAAALLSGSGATRTLTTTTYSTNVLVTVTATDSGSPAQTATASASVEVSAPPALVPPADLSPTTLSSGTTSQAFTFDAATGGGGTITYALAVESSTGTVTLSTSSGRTATLQGLTDGATVRVTLTATDAYGQSVSADGIWGVAVAAIFEESATWNTVEEYDLTTIGTGSISGMTTLTLGGITMTTATVAGSPTGVSLSVDSNGARLTQTSGVGTVTTCWFQFATGPSNFADAEDILVDIVASIGTVPASAAAAFGFGDGVSWGANDFFGFQAGNATALNTAPIAARRFQGGSATTYTLSASQTVNDTFAVQILLKGKRTPLITVSKATDYLGGPRLGISTPMRGTWTGTPGAQSVAAGSTLGTVLTTFKASWVVSSGAAVVTMKKIRVRRLTRPPST